MERGTSALNKIFAGLFQSNIDLTHKQTLKEELHNLIILEERTLRNFDIEREKIKEHTVQYENKKQQWNNIIS